MSIKNQKIKRPCGTERKITAEGERKKGSTFVAALGREVLSRQAPVRTQLPVSVPRDALPCGMKKCDRPSHVPTYPCPSPPPARECYHLINALETLI